MNIMLVILTIILIIILVVIYKKVCFPVDLVYTWVDGNDPKWKEKKEYWQKVFNRTDNYSTGDIRFIENDELKYSLRSVELYMPWVRKIFIVTDNQIPKWLNINHPKIKIVDHKEIFPQDALPIFNSIAIESRLPFIPGLSEHFFYLNDDIFVNKPFYKDLFFTKFGTPILYDNNKYKALVKMILFSSKESKFINELNDKSKNIIKDVYHLDVSKRKSFIGTHTIQPYRKSVYLENLKILGDLITKTTYSKFRTSSNIYRGIFDITDNIRHKNIIKDAHKDIPKKYNFKVIGMPIKNVEDIKKEDPCLFCLNNIASLPKEEAEKQTNYLQERYPNKSSFEK